MTCCLMMLAVLLASSYLWVGILVGGVCLNLDGNAISLVHAVNFTELSHFKFHIDPVLEGAVKYYIRGSQENPMISMIEDVERDASALYTVYTNATWATKPAEMVCNGVKNLNASRALAACTESVGFARELLSASNIHPYYKTFGHQLMCDRMLQGMILLILLSSVVSIILMPLVAICADMDLRKWETYKNENFESHYDLSHEFHEKMPMIANTFHGLPSPSGSPMQSPWHTPRMPWQS
ncbi:HCCS [Symbiodinium pilosum]|uniref:HCCS protein n=1 Tax=Symbiodinium pilosum TaxID=2952 RepID=A0A812RW44_SYMPI|nr:HCCS [Symbiodinium pilosum]